MRHSNIELLRITLMIFIVTWHLLAHGMHLMFDEGYKDFEFSSDAPYLVMMTILCCHVNCFVFISGYYGIKLRREKTIAFITQAVFYCCVCYIIYRLSLFGDEWRHGFRPKLIWHLLFPISTDKYWFVTDYFWLMLLSPLLNEGIQHLDNKKLLLSILAIGTISVSGIRYVYGATSIRFCLFNLIYIIAAYMSKNKIKLSQKQALITFVSTTLLLNIWLYVIYSKNELNGTNINLLFCYSNPLIIVSAISLFYIFNNLNIRNNRFVNWLSSGCLAVYLLTDSDYTRFYNERVIELVGSNIFVLLLTSIVITISISTVENLRAKAFIPINSLLTRSSFIIDRILLKLK